MPGTRPGMTAERELLLRPVELAFLGDALVGLAFALDPVEILVPFRWQQLDHLEAPARARSAVRPCSVLHRLADRVLVTHSRSPFASNQAAPPKSPRRRSRRILFHINTITGIAPIVSEPLTVIWYRVNGRNAPHFRAFLST